GVSAVRPLQSAACGGPGRAGAGRMNPASLFVRRPVASGLLALAVLACGLLCWRLLPVAPLPEVDFPVITVNASLPGARPESKAAPVATPLERALGAISRVVANSRSSHQGSTPIVLQFELDSGTDEAAK